MKIYISGPITGNPEFKRDFAAAAAEIRAAGYEAINPAENELPEGAQWADYMRSDIRLLIDCDAIYMLPGWRNSKGAKIEHDIAAALDIAILTRKEAEA